MTNLSPMRCMLFAIGLTGVGLPLSAFTLPPIVGDVSGQLTLNGWGTLPEIDWQIRVEPTANGDNQMIADLTARGLRMDLELNHAQKEGVITWRILRGSVDLGIWGPPLLKQAGGGTVPADIILNGTLKISGEGTLDGNVMAGMVRVAMTDGRAASTQQNWSLDHIDLASELALDAEGPWLQTLELRAREARAVGLVASQITVSATGDAQRRLHIASAQLAMLGGRISLRPFSLDPSKPTIETTADLDGLALGALAELVPQALSAATGQVSGRIALRWSPDLGVQPGRGSLTVTPTTPASLRLASTPGFLTDHTSERIEWLPGALGKVARWLAVGNPAYDTLERIERGEMPLQVEKLRVELYPDGPNGRRSATAEVVARPPAGSAVELVSFTVNVSGPLDEVLRLGTNDKVKFKIGSKP